MQSDLIFLSYLNSVLFHAGFSSCSAPHQLCWYSLSNCLKILGLSEILQHNLTECSLKTSRFDSQNPLLEIIKTDVQYFFRLSRTVFIITKVFGRWWRIKNFRIGVCKFPNILFSNCFLFMFSKSRIKEINPGIFIGGSFFFPFSSQCCKESLISELGTGLCVAVGLGF